MMPGLDGPGTLGQLRADPVTERIPVIFVTAKAMPREAALFCKMGAIGVIAKPFDPMQLMKQLRTLWDGYDVQQALPLEEYSNKATCNGILRTSPTGFCSALGMRLLCYIRSQSRQFVEILSLSNKSSAWRIKFTGADSRSDTGP
jgi:hypothetical protein